MSYGAFQWNEDDDDDWMESEDSDSDDSSRFKEVLQAVKNGEKDSKTELAWFMLSGCGGAEIDEEGAFALLEERVADNDVEAMWMKGICKEFGIGCEQDVEEAELLYQQSCINGNAIGKFLSENGRNIRGSGFFKYSFSLLRIRSDCFLKAMIVILSEMDEDVKKRLDVLLSIAPWTSLDCTRKQK